AFHQARGVSAHRDVAQRLAWRPDKGPALGRAAQRRGGLILLEDAASFAPWGSLRYTWARRGHQPAVPTSGKRQGSKVWGPWRMARGAYAIKGLQGGFTQHIPKRAGRGSWRKRRSICCCSTTVPVSTRGHRPKRF